MVYKLVKLDFLFLVKSSRTLIFEVFISFNLKYLNIKFFSIIIIITIVMGHENCLTSKIGRYTSIKLSMNKLSTTNMHENVIQ